MTSVTSRIVSARMNSMYSDATWKTPMGNNSMGKGAVLFTGPDGIGDYRVSVGTDNHFVGIGTMSAEGTSELKYIMRPAPQTPHPRPKSRWVGEIGWLVPPYRDHRAVATRQQFKRGEFQKASENRHTHLYQNPWYPGPNDTEYATMYRFTGRNFIPVEKLKPYGFPTPSTEFISSAYAAAGTVSIPVPRQRAQSVANCSRNHEDQFPSLTHGNPNKSTSYIGKRRHSKTSLTDHSYRLVDSRSGSSKLSFNNSNSNTQPNDPQHHNNTRAPSATTLTNYST